MSFVNHQKLPDINFEETLISYEMIGDLMGYEKQDVIQINNIITYNNNKKLVDFVNYSEMLAVGNDGRANKEYDKIGNYRVSSYSEEFSDIIWNNIKSIFDDNEFNFRGSLTTFHDNSDWKPIGINPLMRFIQYKDNNELVVHYDGSYVENVMKRTIMTLIIYLTDNESGKTRFIKDDSYGKHINKKCFDDWGRVANDDELLLTLKPRQCNALLFNHAILHDSEPLFEEEKIIIRTDVICERIL